MGPQGVQGIQGPPGPAATVTTVSVPLVTLTLPPGSPAQSMTVPPVTSVSVPAGSSVIALVAADGVLTLTLPGGTSSGYAVVELHLLVDGIMVRKMTTTVFDVGPSNPNNLSNSWALHALVPLGSGSHDFKIEAFVLVPSSALVSVTANPIQTPGQLNIVLLRQ